MKERTKPTAAHAKSSKSSAAWKHVHAKAASEMKGCLGKAIAAAKATAERNLAERSHTLVARVDEAKTRLGRATAKLRKGVSNSVSQTSLRDMMKALSALRTASLKQIESANTELDKAQRSAEAAFQQQLREVFSDEL